jgi:hypothetical protein
MSIRNLFVAAIAAFVSLVASYSAQAAPLLSNGNFASNGGAGQLTVNTSLTSWTGGGKEGNFGSATTPPVFIYPAGTYSAPGDGFMGTVSFYGFNATTNPPGGGVVIAAAGDPQWKGSISQTINSLNVGDTYAVAFNWASAQQQGFSGNTTEDWQVSLGASSQTTTVASTTSQTFGGWKTASLNFTATSPSEVLAFTAIGTPSGEQPWSLLNGVTLTDTSSVPEPASLGLVGIVAVALLGRRRKQI